MSSSNILLEAARRVEAFYWRLRDVWKHSIGGCKTRGSIILEVAQSAGPSSQKTIGKAVAVDDDNAYDAGNDDVGVINYCEVGGDNNENDEYDDVVLTSTSMNHRSYQL